MAHEFDLFFGEYFCFINTYNFLWKGFVVKHNYVN